jgi:hypothetical protein
LVAELEKIMFASRQRARFGRRDTWPSVERGASDSACFVQPNAQPDDEYRVLPEPPLNRARPEVFDGPTDWIAHADLLQRLDAWIDQPGLDISEVADHDQMIRDSYVAQEQRRSELADELMRLHGHNAIRPFYVYGEGVFNSALGRWLVEVMGLMPYDAWNTIYLPLDAPTAAAMRLPYHPRRSLHRIDALVFAELEAQRASDELALAESVDGMQARWDGHDLARFAHSRRSLRDEIIGYAEELGPVVMDLLTKAQENGNTL